SVHASRPRRRLRDRGDTVSLRESNPGHGLPHRAAQLGRRVSETDRPFDPRLKREPAMLRGLWKLTWLETKIFLREPLGAFGTILIPVLVFGIAGRFGGGRPAAASTPMAGLFRVGVPVFVSVLIAISGVLSLATIISIYREGGILKRLRATPLRPQT